MEGEVLSRRGGANAVGGMGRLVARLNEMWALVGALNALKSGNDEQGVSWAVVDEDGLSQIVQVRFYRIPYFRFSVVKSNSSSRLLPDPSRGASWSRAPYKDPPERYEGCCSHIWRRRRSARRERELATGAYRVDVKLLPNSESELSRLVCFCFSARRCEGVGFVIYNLY